MHQKLAILYLRFFEFTLSQVILIWTIPITMIQFYIGIAAFGLKQILEITKMTLKIKEICKRCPTQINYVSRTWSQIVKTPLIWHCFAKSILLPNPKKEDLKNLMCPFKIRDQKVEQRNKWFYGSWFQIIQIGAR